MIVVELRFLMARPATGVKHGVNLLPFYLIRQKAVLRIEGSMMCFCVAVGHQTQPVVRCV